jgi:hypothetical protein
MKPLLLLAASALALGVSACGPHVPPARAALDCPVRAGDLSRTSASPDGKACTYVTSDGAEVTLQLVALQGGVDQTLTNIETNLLAERVTPERAKEVAKSDKSGADAADKAAKEAEADAKGGIEMHADANGKVSVDGDFTVNGRKTDSVNVDLRDGKTVVAESGDGTTHVNLPGIHITANDKDDTANVQVGPIHIDAGGDGATIRMRQDVRLRGEPLNPERRGFRAMFLYKGDDLPGGLKYVGYEAGGPKRGPITVAVVKSKEHADDDIYSDVKRLVRKNGGV